MKNNLNFSKFSHVPGGSYYPDWNPNKLGFQQDLISNE